MSYPTADDEMSGVCPYLGLADDADSHATYATEAHRCYRLDNPTRIAANHQQIVSHRRREQMRVLSEIADTAT